MVASTVGDSSFGSTCVTGTSGTGVVVVTGTGVVVVTGTGVVVGIAGACRLTLLLVRWSPLVGGGGAFLAATTPTAQVNNNINN